MLKDKEVVSDPQRQYEIARQKHAEQHGGINKTTAAIAEMYHWVRIKETVSMAIKNCPECKDATKIPTVRPVSDGLTSSAGSVDARPQRRGLTQNQQQNQNLNQQQDPNALIERVVNFNDHDTASLYTPSLPSHNSHTLSQHNLYQPPAPVASMQTFQNQLQGRLQQALHGYSSASHGLPLDPQIMTHGHSDQSHQFQLHDEHERKYDHDHSQMHGYQAHEGGEDGHYELDTFPSDLHDGSGGAEHGNIIDMQDADGVGGHEGNGGDDTRLATARHVTHHDQPMAFVHEGHVDEHGQGGGKEEDDLFGEGKNF